MSVGQQKITFEGYEGRYRPEYEGRYSVVGYRFPAVDSTRTWDIVRVAGGPVAGRHAAGTFEVLARGFDMMGKAYRELVANRDHFETCRGEGRCRDVAHPTARGSSRARGVRAIPGPPSRPDNVVQPRIEPTAPRVARRRLRTPAAGHGGLAPRGAVLGQAVIAVDEFPPSFHSAAAAVADSEGRVTIPVRTLEVEAWQGPVPGWFYIVPSKPPVSRRRSDGTLALSYPEFVVRDLTEHAGWSAFWVKNWGGRAFWVDLGESGGVPGVVPPPGMALIRRLDAAVLDSWAAEGIVKRDPPGGCWDVFGWRRGRPVFIEVKGVGEGFKSTQIRWLGAALSLQVPLEDFSVTEYRVSVAVAGTPERDNRGR